MRMALLFPVVVVCDRRFLVSARQSAATIGSVKILFLQLKRIGDLILTTPAIAALDKSFPDAHVTLVVSNECAHLLPAISNVHRILIARRNLRDLGLFSSIAGRKFDYCI